MCGIAGIHIFDEAQDEFSKQDLNTFIDGLFLGIENRGKDATGYVATDRKQRLWMAKNNVKAETFITTRRQLPVEVKTVLLHTRAQTQGTATKMENNHPVQYRSCYATHNGMIRNDDEILQKMNLDGVDRPAEVDSIVVPVLMDAAGGFDKLPEFLKQIQGSYALACLDPENNPNEIMLVRGATSPLYFIDATWFFAWASSASAIRDAWEKTFNKDSVPEYGQFSNLSEGEYIRIKDDEVELKRYIPEDELWTRPARSYTSGPTLGYCFECGFKKATKLVPESEKDKRRNKLVSWEIPLCDECQKLSSKVLTYDHADREVKVKWTSLDELCATCDWFPRVSFSDEKECIQCYRVTQDKERKAREQERLNLLKQMGLPESTVTVKCKDCDRAFAPLFMEVKGDHLVCKGCFNSDKRIVTPEKGSSFRATKCEKCKAYKVKMNMTLYLGKNYCPNCIDDVKAEQERKPVATMSADNPDVDKVLTLNPGDEIPSDIRSAFKNCEACNHNNVGWIGRDGFAICTTCHRNELAAAAVDSLEAKNLAELQRQVQEREKVHAEDNPMYEKCVACPEAPWVLKFELNETAWGYACDECYQLDLDHEKAEQEAETCEVETPDVQQEVVDEALLAMKIKVRACVETAWQVDQPGGFVMWCIDECDVDKFKDKEMRREIEDVIEKFGDNHFFIEALIRNGRDDLVPEKSRLTEEAVLEAVRLGTRRDA